MLLSVFASLSQDGMPQLQTPLLHTILSQTRDKGTGEREAFLSHFSFLGERSFPEASWSLIAHVSLAGIRLLFHQSVAKVSLGTWLLKQDQCLLAKKTTGNDSWVGNKNVFHRINFWKQSESFYLLSIAKRLHIQYKMGTKKNNIQTQRSDQERNSFTQWRAGVQG